MKAVALFVALFLVFALVAAKADERPYYGLNSLIMAKRNRYGSQDMFVRELTPTKMQRQSNLLSRWLF